MSVTWPVCRNVNAEESSLGVGLKRIYIFSVSLEWHAKSSYQEWHAKSSYQEWHAKSSYQEWHAKSFYRSEKFLSRVTCEEFLSRVTCEDFLSRPTFTGQSWVKQCEEYVTTSSAKSMVTIIMSRTGSSLYANRPLWSVSRDACLLKSENSIGKIVLSKFIVKEVSYIVCCVLFDTLISQQEFYDRHLYFIQKIAVFIPSDGIKTFLEFTRRIRITWSPETPCTIFNNSEIIYIL